MGDVRRGRHPRHFRLELEARSLLNDGCGIGGRFRPRLHAVHGPEANVLTLGRLTTNPSDGSCTADSRRVPRRGPTWQVWSCIRTRLLEDPSATHTSAVNWRSFGLATSSGSDGARASLALRPLMAICHVRLLDLLDGRSVHLHPCPSTLFLASSVLELYRPPVIRARGSGVARHRAAARARPRTRRAPRFPPWVRYSRPYGQRFHRAPQGVMLKDGPGCHAISRLFFSSRLCLRASSLRIASSIPVSAPAAASAPDQRVERQVHFSERSVVRTRVDLHGAAVFEFVFLLPSSRRALPRIARPPFGPRDRFPPTSTTSVG